ncbi:2-C-methyl-D-erythritol 2,4-cyclodiphosphate synthase [Pseudoteredinibacter isoporae]|uniref:2-C-methyl-D-erythritol 2,4-cyclodiphosphate synthase n=1 Tax=Pseudoteredinibacter isoporae TaxID=570281 RepID=UPI0033414055
MRVGQGYDVHAFEANEPFKTHIMIGGVSIDHERGLKAHSDGDVLLHALCDALLGAAGLGDIGKHFPDTDTQYKGIDSRELLRLVVQKLSELQYQLVNADMTIVAEAPKMAPHISAMRERISADCACDPGAINVKATTTEKLGFAGRKEGIAAYAVVLIEKA